MITDVFYHSLILNSYPPVLIDFLRIQMQTASYFAFDQAFSGLNYTALPQLQTKVVSIKRMVICFVMIGLCVTLTNN